MVYSNLSRTEGGKEEKAMRNVPIMYLSGGLNGSRTHFKKIAAISVEDSLCLNTPKAVYHFAKKHLYRDRPAEEYVYMIGVNSGNMPIAVSEVSHGTVSETFVRPREVMIRAVRMGACGFILTHNHVSGKADPSMADKAVTWHLQTLGEMMNLPLYDHIIVGEKGYTSPLQSQDLEPNDKETIYRNIFELLNYSYLGLQTLCCDPETGTVVMQLPDSKWVVKVDVLPKDTVL